MDEGVAHNGVGPEPAFDSLGMDGFAGIRRGLARAGSDDECEGVSVGKTKGVGVLFEGEDVAKEKDGGARG